VLLGHDGKGADVSIETGGNLSQRQRTCRFGPPGNRPGREQDRYEQGRCQRQTKDDVAPMSRLTKHPTAFRSCSSRAASQYRDMKPNGLLEHIPVELMHHVRVRRALLPLPTWGEGGGEGVTGLSRFVTPSPHPSPSGRGSRARRTRTW